MYVKLAIWQSNFFVSQKPLLIDHGTDDEKDFDDGNDKLLFINELN